MYPTETDKVFLKQSSIHNNGIFAKVPIKKGERIIEYAGEKVSKAEGDRRADQQEARHKADPSKGRVYVFELNDKYDIDGDVPYNLAKYMNHSCDPNCDVDIGENDIWIIADRDIAAGEELTYNYSYDLEDFEDHPCRCGSRRCVGYIVDEDLWPELKKKLQEKKRRS